MKRESAFVLTAIAVLCWTGPVFADYTLILTNGRRITVQSYREEGQMIKFQGLGGEIGISKDQIQAIRKLGEAEAQGLNLSAPGPASDASQDMTDRSQAAGGSLSPEEQRAKEEKEYQQKLSELTSQLKATRDRYSQAIRGTISPEPSQLATEEQTRVIKEDVISRFRDAASNPSEPAPVKLLTPSPFTSLPPTIVEERPPARAPTRVDNLPDSETQKELSELRNQAIQLENERQRLIDEARQKNLSTGSLFLE